MRNALQRQLSTTAWQILGALIALGIFVAGATLWGNHIEHRIDRAQRVGVADHRALNRLATAIGERESNTPTGGDASQSPSTATQQPAPASPAHHGTSGGSPAGGHHGSGSSPGPTGSPAGGESPDQEPVPGSSLTSSSSTTSTTTTETTTEQPSHPVLEDAGAALQHVGESLGNSTEGLTHSVEGTGALDCALSPQC